MSISTILKHFSETFFSFAFISRQTCLKKCIKSTFLGTLTIGSFILLFNYYFFFQFIVVSSSSSFFILFILSISSFSITFSYLSVTIFRFSRFSISFGSDIFTYAEKIPFFIIYISYDFKLIF